MPKTKDITQEPFVPYKLEEERKKSVDKTFTVWMSESEYKDFQKIKAAIRQPKDSTAIKQLAKIGANLLGEPSMRYTIDTLFKNNRKNERLGIQEID